MFGARQAGCRYSFCRPTDEVWYRITTGQAGASHLMNRRPPLMERAGQVCISVWWIVSEVLCTVAGRYFMSLRCLNARAWPKDLAVDGRVIDLMLACLRRRVHAAQWAVCRSGGGCFFVIALLRISSRDMLYTSSYCIRERLPVLLARAQSVSCMVASVSVRFWLVQLSRTPKVWDIAPEGGRLFGGGRDNYLEVA